MKKIKTTCKNSLSLDLHDEVVELSMKGQTVTLNLSKLYELEILLSKARQGLEQVVKKNKSSAPEQLSMFPS